MCRRINPRLQVRLQKDGPGAPQRIPGPSPFAPLASSAMARLPLRLSPSVVNQVADGIRASMNLLDLFVVLQPDHVPAAEVIVTQAHLLNETACLALRLLRASRDQGGQERGEHSRANSVHGSPIGGQALQDGELTRVEWLSHLTGILEAAEPQVSAMAVHSLNQVPGPRIPPSTRNPGPGAENQPNKAGICRGTSSCNVLYRS